MAPCLFKFKLYFAQVVHGPMHDPHCHPLLGTAKFPSDAVCQR